MVIVLALFFPSSLISGGLVLLLVALEMLRDALWVVHVDVEHGVGDMSCKGCVYLAIHNVGSGCAVLKEVCGDVMLMGKNAP